MKPIPIENEEQYEEYLREVEALIALDPKRGTPEAERLSLLALAIEVYEKARFIFEKPSPIEAIKFRMEEQNLKQSDLIPYIGSKSKVSEVLSGKRRLTVPMIRALVKYLGIPAEILIQESIDNLIDISPNQIVWDNFPLEEMHRKGWIRAKKSELRSRAKDIMNDFLKPIGGLIPTNALWRRTIYTRGEKNVNQYTLLAWAAQVLIKAKRETSVNAFDRNIINIDFLREVARLSCFDQGPVLARDFLKKYGIILIIEKHLSETKLDGGCMLDNNGNPVIGITLRYDRIDHFWYTLLHELSHIYKHLKASSDVYLDDLEYNDVSNLKERESDRIAGEAFISRNIWKRSDAFNLQTSESVIEFARKLRIHPAIVAGRIRKETGNYSRLSELIGQGQIRKLFGASDG